MNKLHDSRSPDTNLANAETKNDYDSRVRKDFTAIKDTRTAEDIKWFLELHSDHDLSKLVRSWKPKKSASTWANIRSIAISIGAVLMIVGPIGGYLGDWGNALLVLGVVDGGTEVKEAEEREGAATNQPPITPPDTSYLAEFALFLESAGIVDINPAAFLVMGPSNAAGRCEGLNSLPPKSLWPNIVPLAKVLVKFKERLGAQLELTSVYRSPEYNQCLGGYAKSQHIKFRATDFRVASGTPAEWANILFQMRAEGLFQGGIGTYNSFVHVDTRGANVNW